MDDEGHNDLRKVKVGSPWHASVDWDGRQHNAVRRMLNGLERFSLALENPVQRVVGNPAFNPLYHTGTITTFLLLVILVTGAYLTFFYQFGFNSSYQAVSAIEGNLVGRVIRAVHRYASAAAVFTALLHGWRTFFQDRFRGPRWLAWVSGIGMATLVWVIGISGYWLIWDERAQLLNQTLINLVGRSRLGISFLMRTLFSQEASTGWVFMVGVITVHLGLSALVGLLYWYHLRRLTRPKLLPPRTWMWAVGALLVLVAVLVPVGMIPQASFEHIPSEVPLDLFFLFYLPAALGTSPGWFWGGLGLLVIVLATLPWILTGKPQAPIQVSAERCTGCTLCAADCPYKAIQMVPRDDGQNKAVAQVDPDMCVACGVCIGSCPTLALTLGQQPAEALWEEAGRQASKKQDEPVKVVFVCERHAFQGAKAWMDEADVQVIPVTCAGMLHPDLLAQARAAGAAEVQVIGCPPEDCTNREGNQHLQERLDGERKPVWRSKFGKDVVISDWRAPNEFQQAMKAKTHQGLATAYRFQVGRDNVRKFIPALVLLGVVLGLQVMATTIPYRPIAAQSAEIQVVLNHRAGYPLQGVEAGLEPELGIETDTRLELWIDGQVSLAGSYQSRGGDGKAEVFERLTISPGEHHLKLVMFDRPDKQLSQTLLDESVVLEAGQVLILAYADGSTGKDPRAGEKLYYETSLGTNASCRICHSLEPGEDLVGPSFAGIATRAGERVPGMSAEAYLRQSIVAPDAYVVSGFPSGLMVPNLAETLTDEQIDDLVAFLMTLK